MSDTIYVLKGTTGEYDMVQTWTVGYFTGPEAKEEARAVEDRYEEFLERHLVEDPGTGYGHGRWTQESIDLVLATHPDPGLDYITGTVGYWVSGVDAYDASKERNSEEALAAKKAADLTKLKGLIEAAEQEIGGADEALLAHVKKMAAMM